MKIGVKGTGMVGSTATYYGIGSALARIVNVILRDQRTILTVCTPEVEVLDLCDVTVSLPHLIGGQGVMASFPLPLDRYEEAALQASASIVCDAILELDSAAKGENHE